MHTFTEKDEVAVVYSSHIFMTQGRGGEEGRKEGANKGMGGCIVQGSGQAPACL